MAYVQALNRQKPSVLFGKNTSSSNMASINREVGVVANGRYEKYLDLPTLIGISIIVEKYFVYKEENLEEDS